MEAKSSEYEKLHVEFHLSQRKLDDLLSKEVI
jgi:hypothetical protein